MSIKIESRASNIDVNKKLEEDVKAHKVREIGLSCLKGLGATALAGMGAGGIILTAIFTATAYAVATQTPYWPIAIILALAAISAIVLTAMLFAAAHDMYDKAKESANNASRFDLVVEARKQEVNSL